MGLGVFVVSTLLLLHVIRFSNGLLTPPSLELINFLYDDSFLSPIFLPLHNGSSQNSEKLSPPEEDQRFEQSALDTYSILSWN